MQRIAMSRRQTEIGSVPSRRHIGSDDEHYLKYKQNLSEPVNDPVCLFSETLSSNLSQQVTFGRLHDV